MSLLDRIYDSATLTIGGSLLIGVAFAGALFLAQGSAQTPPVSMTGAVTAVAGAATLNTQGGIVTSEPLNAADTYTLTLTDSVITGASAVLVVPFSGANAGVQVANVTPGPGKVVIVLGMSYKFTGALSIPFMVLN